MTRARFFAENGRALAVTPLPAPSTDVFEQFTSAESTTSCQWLQLQDMKPIKALTGTFYRLTCLADDGATEIQATCDEKWREHLRPYIDLLVKSRDGHSTETPVVPVFRGDDGKWRFAWRGAERDYAHLKDRGPTSSTTKSPSGTEVTRLQVSVTAAMAERFKIVAQERGLAHTELLLQLIRDTVTQTG